MPPTAVLGLALSLTYSPPGVVAEMWGQVAETSSGRCTAQLLLRGDGTVRSVSHTDCPVDVEHLRGLLALWDWETPGAARIELDWEGDDLTLRAPQVLRSAWRAGPPMGDVVWRRRLVGRVAPGLQPGRCWVRVVVSEQGRASIHAFDVCPEVLRPSVSRVVRRWRAERRGAVVQAQVQVVVAR